MTADDTLLNEDADPFTLFADWYEQAKTSEPEDANAMTVASVDKKGMPNARIVLLKEWSKAGFIFYTNLTSAKGLELLRSRQAAFLFHWKSVRRQIRLRGPISQVEDARADAYFASRPRQSQIGAWASDQSSPLASRDVFEARLADIEARYEGQEIPRPPHWSGVLLEPMSMEFWQDRAFRLHDRVRFTQAAGRWQGQRLYP